MIIDKTYEGLIDIRHRYKIRGSIETDESLHINLDKPLYVCRDIKSGGELISTESIQSGGCIESGWDIKTKGGIISYGDIKSGGNIVIGEGILSGGHIIADLDIKSGGNIQSDKSIICGCTIICKAALYAKLRIFAGVYCGQKKVDDKDKEIICSQLIIGEVAYGHLIETDENN